MRLVSSPLDLSAAKEIESFIYPSFVSLTKTSGRRELSLNEQPKIGIGKMMLIGVGWFGVQFFWGFNTAVMPLFLNKFTDTKTMIGLVLSLAGVAGCIVPPIVGYISDRTSGRFGRRRPYIFCGLLGVLICLFALPQLAAFTMVAVVSCLMYFSLRSAETPYLSLLPDIVPPEQRGSASGVMNLFGGIGLISYFIIGGSIWEKNPHFSFYLVAVIAFAAALITISILREPDVPLEELSGGGGPFAYVKGVTSESSAMRFFIAQFFWWLGFWIITSFVVLFITEELGVPEKEAFNVLAVFSIVSALFALPLGILGDKVGRRNLLSVAVFLWGVFYIIVGLSQTLTQILLLVGFTAIPFAAVMSVGLAYLLDLIPPERTAEFVGFSVISVAAAQIAGPLIGGVVIDTLGFWAIFPATALFMWVGLILLQFVQPRVVQEATPEG
jgi:maltose/moltooligosaccharide transporter